MKKGWKRSTQVIVPNDQTLSDMLHSFLRDRGITGVEPIGGGLSNSNIKLSLTDGDDVVLRIYNAGGTKGPIEKRILERVQSNLPVPEVLYHDFTLSQIEYPFLVLNWVEGFQLSELFNEGDHDKLSDAGQEVGKWLAEMHSIQFSAPGFFDEELNVKEFLTLGADSFRSVLGDIIGEGYVEENIGSEMVEEVRRFADERAYLLNRIGEQRSLVHSDFNPLNILVKTVGEGVEVTGILDWEFSFCHSPLHDIGNLLRYEDVENSPFLRPFISSYLKHGGELPAEWLQQAKMMDMIALCDLVSKKGCEETRLRDIQSLFRKTFREWELYAELQENIR
ncbi:aminoglycoside phosphotransferase family protein [Halobacillus litoralis]|uniref:phosphotransferase family protein n=1 Tax=Halobacillus litoralis TaxID=45668 RepID=UPI001CD5B04E|nr:aminoglycoside phosphotransferase family protein [Halobacillus litoralis]MCA0970868.1 aminoglycoside phosphotransferase family protein [Halobacillus litoralis]